MSLSVAIQMDPIEAVDIDADSTFALALEARRRGHTLFHYQPHDLVFRDGQLLARCRPLEVRRQRGDHFTLGPPEMVDLADVDVVLMRQDPPFDMAYITATHLLEHVHPATLVVNDPAHVRNAPEKLFVTHFDGVMPPTLITTDRAEIVAFREQHRDIIVKPLFGNGGAGVFHIAPGDENLTALLETSYLLYRQPVPDLEPGETVKQFPKFDEATFFDPDFDHNLVLREKFEDDLVDTKCFAVRRKQWKLISVPGVKGPIHRLFDLDADPQCRTNLVKRQPDVYVELRALLHDLPAQAGHASDHTHRSNQTQRDGAPRP